MLVYLKDVFSEALTPCLLLYLSIKVALVIIVTSARSGGEAQASVAGPSHAACVLGRVESRSHPEFLPKVGSELRWNGDINLAVSSPRPRDSRGFFMTWLLRKLCIFIFWRLSLADDPWDPFLYQSLWGWLSSGLAVEVNSLWTYCKSEVKATAMIHTFHQTMACFSFAQRCLCHCKSTMWALRHSEMLHNNTLQAVVTVISFLQMSPGPSSG